ncbi:MAG: trehalose-6-phosphate synthase [Acidobacteria bacterium]|nr:trehalose-6-phosphate synthase [Acidobacteriota bacterium]
MRLSLRFILPLLIALAAIAYGVVPMVDGLTLRWSTRDLDSRSSMIATTLQDPLAELIEKGNREKIFLYFDKITQDERLFALGYCPAGPGGLIATRTFPASLNCESLAAGRHPQAKLLTSVSGLLHVSSKEVLIGGRSAGWLILVHDMSFVQRRSEETRRYVFYFFIGMGAIVSLITVIIAQLSWRGWNHGMRALLRGEGLVRPMERFVQPELRPLARDLRTLINEIESEHRTRDVSMVTWTPDSLRRILHEELKGDDVIVVSNREPYIHVSKDGRLEVHRPASGLVTALEPVMRACSGVWIAHGSGSGDQEAVDAQDRVAVPPENPAYQLRRVWLTKEEEAGYYYGFSNEGLWPLCHIAHVRPTFRTRDWEHYVAVNRKFAEVVKEEAKTDDPIVLVQDYHFALLPRMIRELLPRATVISFWHIPWPNSEAISICPWRMELLDGMLGSSILGFHTQSHCNNFLDTVDRLLEARVDREALTVTYRREPSSIHRYPISIAWPPPEEIHCDPVPACRAKIRRRYHLAEDQRVGIGVDRLDYTKGILERFKAVERLLEAEPSWIGRFTFLQIAAPSRSSIEQYQDFELRVRALEGRINARFGKGDWLPILLKIEHYEPEAVHEHYRAAEFCYVSSLHDGMNLVAKEFVASRNDERGVLILSQFAGASRELPEALIVNPYDIDQCAAAMHLALTMPQAEQRARMRLMRGLIQEFNVYRWAGKMLLDAAHMRMRGRLTQYKGDIPGEAPPSGEVIP